MPEESMVQSLYESDIPYFVPVLEEQPKTMEVAIYAEVTQPNGYVTEWMLDPRIVIQRLLGLEKPTDVLKIGDKGKFDLQEDDQQIVIKKQPALTEELSKKPKKSAREKRVQILDKK